MFQNFWNATVCSLMSKQRGRKRKKKTTIYLQWEMKLFLEKEEKGRIPVQSFLIAVALCEAHSSMFLLAPCPGKVIRDGYAATVGLVQNTAAQT